ncbi:MAG: ABC transporter permease [Anaerolineae bacterium]|nr:ABC transporter permease [Caldilineales bacterium]MCX7851784.1 ABC transporter permease [Caldilineales bacterium]MDW8267830.1 ABC transporter permease [Anaerolineae bacterium]
MLSQPRTVAPVDLVVPARRSRGLWYETAHALLRRRSGQIGLILIGFLVLVAIFAPQLATHDPLQVLIDVEPNARRRTPPCIHAANNLPAWPLIRSFQCDPTMPQHLFGIDGNVRDLYSRVLYGARVSLRVGFYVVFVALVSGTLIGSISGYVGGRVDNILMRLMDIVLAFPSLILAIAINSALLQALDTSLLKAIIVGLRQVLGFEDVGLLTALMAVSLVSIPTFARLARASVLSIKEQEYVMAARALGASHSRILLRAILPNAMAPLIVAATLGVASAILDTAALSFLGLGARPPTPEWGAMIGAERNQMFTAPHLIIFPGLAIILTVLGFNLLGDGLRDALDPRMKNR